MASAIIHYFSGTGNTSRAAHIIAEELKAAGYQVRVHSIELGLPKCLYDLEVFAFPVYSFAPPSIMLRYMRSMPRQESKAAVLAVHGQLRSAPGWQGQATAQAGRILGRLGRSVFLADAVGYPASITQLINPPQDRDAAEIIAQADDKVRMISARIAAQQESINHCNILNRSWSGLMGFLFSTIGHREIGKLYVADSSCNSCGLCARYCPVGAVRLVGGRPRWSWHCEACERCINICPKSAIQSSYARALVLVVALLLPFHRWIPAVLGLHLPDTFGLLEFAIWLAGGLGFVYILDLILAPLEGIAAANGLMTLSFTGRFRRYLAPGFHPGFDDLPDEEASDDCNR